MKRGRIGLFIVYVIITIALLFEIIYSAFFSMEKQYIARMEETAAQISSAIVVRMNKSIDLLSVVSLEFEEYEDIHCDESVKKLGKIAERTDFTRMWLTKASGEAISSDFQTAKANGRKYLINGLEGKCGVSEVQTSSISNEKNVVLYTPIYHDSEISGLLIGIYALSELEDTIGVECFAGEGFSDIFLPNGDIIVGFNDDALDGDTNLFTYLSRQNIKRRKSLEEVEKEISSKQTGVVAYLGNNCYDYVYYRPVGLNDWYLLIGMPENLVSDDFMKLVHSSLFIAFSLLGLTMIPYTINMRARSKELQQLAKTDSLTGLMTRGAIEDAVNDKMKSSPDKLYALMVMDIDNFKMINDRYGHIVGDKVLKKYPVL